MWLTDRPLPGEDGPGGQNIWVMDRVGGGWGEPYPLPEPVTSTDAEFFPSVTRDGTLYFTRAPAAGGGNFIYRSRLVDGTYQEPELLPPQVNAGRNRFNAFVDPDEGFLILGVLGAEDSRGGTDYYVVFRTPEDEWSEPVNLGPAINTEGSLEHSPYVSPDGRFFFFMTTRPDWGMLAPDGELVGDAVRSMVAEPNNGSWDIYWVDASFLRGLRPQGF